MVLVVNGRVTYLFFPSLVSTFRTDYYICGIAPLELNQLVILGYPKERDTEQNKASRPVLCVVAYRSCDHVEICRDSLSLRG